MDVRLCGRADELDRLDRAPRRDSDVTGPRFLAAAAHPTIGFRGTADGGTALAGVLTVRGVESPLTRR